MDTNNTCFSTAFGDFNLSRFSRSQSRNEQNLRAWDAGDELLLQWLSKQGLEASERVLIANDSYGALTCALYANARDNCTDSYLSQRSAIDNAAANPRPDAVDASYYSSVATPSQPVDWLLIKLPKTLALLEDQLYRYRPLLAAGAKVVAAGMVKHMSPSAVKLFEKIIGPAHTSLAEKKARLIFAEPQPQSWQGESPYPTQYQLEDSDLLVDNHANVFSRQSLDIGTRFFLQHLPSGEAAINIADLGCGNGLLGIAAARQFPQAQVDFYDESFMALASAESNFKRSCEPNRGKFFASDGLQVAAAASYDLVLNNPPFHQQNVVGDFVALQMFKDARRVLSKKGELWVVGNRHLGYHHQLKKLFGHCELVAANKKFVILRAIKL